MPIDSFSAAQLLRIASISRRMMNRWIALKALRPSVRLSTGKGVDHRFDLSDLLQAATLGRLCAVGCPLAVAALAARHIAETALPDDLDNDDAPDDFLLV